MAVLSALGNAYNQTRQTYLATALAVADTHWTRLRGLLGVSSSDFRNGTGLWIVPCHGVHTLGMGFPIDIVYLDQEMRVIHLQSALPPWRFAPVRAQATSVLELPIYSVGKSGTMIGDKIKISVRKNGRIPSA